MESSPQVRDNQALENGAPLSAYRFSGTPRRTMARRRRSWHARAFSWAKNAPSMRSREWSSTMRNNLARTDETVFGQGTCGPISTSVIHRSFGRDAS